MIYRRRQKHCESAYTIWIMMKQVFTNGSTGNRKERWSCPDPILRHHHELETLTAHNTKRDSPYQTLVLP